MMNLLGRKFYQEWAINFACVFVSIMALISLLQFSGTLSLILHSGLNIVGILKVLVLVLPSLMVIALPLSAMIGLILLLSRWSRDNEWLALQAAGVSKIKIYGFVLPSALLLTLFVFVLSSIVVPHSLKKAEQLITTAGSKLVLSKVKAGQIVELFDGYLLYVAGINHKNEWENPFLVVELGTQRYSIRAEKGKVLSENNALKVVFSNGSMESGFGEIRLNGNFDTFSMNLLDTNSRKTVAVDIFQHKKLNMLELSQSLYSCQGYKCLKLQEEISRRVSVSCSGILFCFIALLFMGSRTVAKLPLILSISLFIALLYYFMERLGSILAEKNVISAYLGPWLPVVILLLMLIFIPTLQYFRKTD